MPCCTAHADATHTRTRTHTAAATITTAAATTTSTATAVAGDRIVFLTKIRKKQGRDQVALSNAYIDLQPEDTPTTTTTTTLN